MGNIYLSPAQLSQYAVYMHRNFQTTEEENAVWRAVSIFTKCAAYNVCIINTGILL